MKQKIEMITDNEKAQNPCQLKKIWGNGNIACTFECADTHGWPVFYIDSNNNPITGVRNKESA